MKKKNQYRNLFLSLVILITILYLNDTYWKHQFSNAITGKLSDFVGLFTMPIVASLFLSKIKKWLVVIIGFGFILWKTPISESLINLWNTFNIFQIGRTIDYSDYFALLVLPFAHCIIQNLNTIEFKNQMKTKLNPIIFNLSMVAAFFIFCSTSKQEPAYIEGDVYIDKDITIKSLDENEILSKLRANGLSITTDSLAYIQQMEIFDEKYYQIRFLPINSNLDTLFKVNFRIYENESQSLIRIINLSVKDDSSLQNWKELKRISSYFESKIRTEIEKMLL